MPYKEHFTFEELHRMGSEALMYATHAPCADAKCLEYISMAESYANTAIDVAENLRQTVLALGFLQTCTTMKAVIHSAAGRWQQLPT